MSAKLTIDQLKQHPSFTALTSRQQQMVLGFLETGNRLKAVRAAYSCKDSSARSMASTYFQNPRILACLNVASGLGAREVFEAELQRAIRKPQITAAQIAALKLYAELKGWVTATQAGKKKSAVSTASVNDITSQPAYARVPVGCTPLVDAAGTIRGYQQPDGKKVRLADVEVTR